jgi:succinate dehydrogenase / fumarate reductase cytochrome b subunit
MNNSRPKFLKLYQIRLPLPGFVSILHRFSGALLFLALPLLLWLLDQSLHSSEHMALLLLHAVKLVLLLVMWAFLHHFCAGVRFLALDLHAGVRLKQARASSIWVLAVSMVLTVLLGVRLW